MKNEQQIRAELERLNQLIRRETDVFLQAPKGSPEQRKTDDTITLLAVAADKLDWVLTDSEVPELGSVSD